MTDFVSPVVSSTQSFFREEALVVELLTQCSQIVQGDTATPTPPTTPHNHHPEFLKIAQDARKCIDIIETYQEQPAILDASLEVMVAPIMVGFRQAVAQHTARVAADTGLTPSRLLGPTSSRLIRVSKLLYTVCKVRGYKKVVRLFPHEVADLEPVFHLLQAQDTDDHETWHVRYSLLLWMSIIVIVPFDLQTIDSSVGSSTEGPSLVDRIISVCKMYLRDSGPARNAAALCLSKLLTRPDMEARHLTEFLVWANSVVAASVDDGSDGSDASTQPGNAVKAAQYLGSVNFVQGETKSSTLRHHLKGKGSVIYTSTKT